MPTPLDHRVALTVLSGLDAETKVRVALTLLRHNRQGWAVLDNDGGRCANTAGGLSVPVAISEGCACCTGQVVLHAALVALIRQHRPERLLLLAAATAEPVALQRALAQGIAMGAWEITQRLCVRDANTASRLSPDARALWDAQQAAADAVIHCDSGTADVEILRQLATTSLPTASPVSKASSRRIIS